MRYWLYLALGIVLHLHSAALAGRSTFTDSINGWTLDGIGILIHEPAGGQPGGRLRFNDGSDEPAEDPDEGWIVAPASFLGDWSSVDGSGSISWQQMILDPGEGAIPLAAKVTFSGPAGSAVSTSMGYLDLNWQKFTVPMQSSAWQVTGSWAGLLACVTDFRIRIEGAANTAGVSLDSCAIDNVVLAAPGEVIYVNHAATGASTGKTWPDAFRSLHDALTVAQPGDTVWVAAGRCLPTISGGDRGISFVLPSGVRLYGGFAGTEDATFDLNDRNLIANESTLSGDLNADDGPGFAGFADNSYHVVVAIDNTTDTVLDGFTISGGNADESGTDGQGGGLLLHNSTCTVHRCRFVDNWGSNGGAISAWGQSHAAITECVFLRNGALLGAGVYCSSSNPVLHQCVLAGNTADSGAGVYADQSAPTFVNCIISGNHAAQDGGGIRNVNVSSPQIINSTLSGNTAQSKGGGLASRLGCYPQIRNSIVWGNTVNGSATQAAQLQQEMSSSHTVTNSCIQGSWTGTGNIAVNPQFRDPDGPDDVAGTEDDDLRLTAGSPAIDAGDNTFVPSGVAYDVAGRARFIDDPTVADSGGGTPPVVDMGAHEYVPAFILGGTPILVPEGDATELTIALSEDPQQAIEIAVSQVGGDPDIAVVSGSVLLFNSSNWWITQTVTLAASHDADFSNGVAWIEIHSDTVGTMVVAATEVDVDPPPSRLYVDRNATGTNDGTSWTNAFRELRDALATLASLGNPPTEIWVAQGIYTPVPVGGSRTGSFCLSSGLELHGGFAGWLSVAYPGGETEREQRNPWSNPTVLSGDVLANDGPNWANISDNSYHVIDCSEADSTAVLDGFVIQGGNANGASPFSFGGGLYGLACSPIVRQCSFIQNRATWGGGAYFGNASSPLLSSCRFLGNLAYNGRGGGVYAQIDGFPVLASCLFSANSASREGGGIHCRTRTDISLYNCTLTANSAANLSGGIYAESPVRIWNSVLWGNSLGTLINQETQLYRTTTYQVNYSCIQGWTGSLGGAGNIGDDPRFENPVGADGVGGTWDDDTRLGPGSPCIDAGRNNDVPAWLTTDLAGNPRFRDDPSIRDTGGGISPIVDMGVYEAPPRQGVLVTSDPVYVPEGDEATLGVALSEDPGGAVEVLVAVNSGDPDISIVSPSTLFFDSQNWASPQTVTLAANLDIGFACGATIIKITSDATWPREVLAIEVDSDPFPAVVYVDRQAAGSATGLTWADAFVRPQDAVAAVLSRADRPSGSTIAQVWVAQGLYCPAGPGGDRTASFTLHSNIALYGGFAGLSSALHPGGETELSQRNPAANVTILSGDLNGDDGPSFTNNTENSHHVVNAGDATATAVLDGFLVTGGNANGDSLAGYHRGGGLYTVTGSPTIRNCTFSRNVAVNAGGAVAMLSVCTPVFDSCAFGRNQSMYGGAVYLYRGKPVFANCLLWGNVATLDGGALYMSHSSTVLTMFNCTVASNSCNGNGGGFRVVNTPVITLTNSIVWGNHTGGTANEDTQLGLQTYTSTNYTFNHCCVQGWTGGLGGTANSGLDPRFQDVAGVDGTAGTEDDDLTLAPGSPCIDAGHNNSVAAWAIADLAGNPRFQEDPSVPDAGTGTAPIVDIGAYEMPLRQGAVVVGDPVQVPEGQTAGFTVALAMDPGQQHTVTIAYHEGDSDISVQSGGQLTFDSSNWWIPQTVTLSAAADHPDWANGRTVFRITSDAIWTREVVAWEVDWDSVPVRVYVDQSAVGGQNTGTTWVDAFIELRDALEAVTTRPGAQEIWVAKGAYRPAAFGGSRFASFALIDGVALYGGFGGVNSLDYAGGETDLEQRRPRKNVTILTGDLAGDDIGGLDDPSRAENSYHVITARYVGLAAVLDGFKISGGNATASSYPTMGGGLDLYQASPTIRDCRIVGNQASYGGGMCIALNSHPELIHCRFLQNRATTGGGGLYLSNTCHPTLLNCLFMGNASLDGGGVRNYYRSNPTFINCVFSGNTATRYGGGLYSTTSSRPTLVNNTLAANYAPTGGGIVNRTTTGLTLANCVLWGNQNTDGNGQSAQLFEESVTSPAAIDHTCIQGWTGSYGGVGNISIPPLFVSVAGPDGLVGTEDDNLRLDDGSPCIDAGNTAQVPTDVTTDADGNLRVTLDAVDMGAYEYSLEGAVRLLQAFSRRTHGAAGPFEVDLVHPLSGQTRPVEPRQGGPTQIVVTFSRPVFAVGDLDLSDVVLTASSGSGGVVTNLSASDNHLIVDLGGATDGTAVRMAFPGIQDSTGNVVENTLCFNVLAGDADGNSAVNIFDLVVIRNALNGPVNAECYRRDVTADGAVNIFDLVMTRNNLNTLVASPCP